MRTGLIAVVVIAGFAAGAHAAPKNAPRPAPPRPPNGDYMIEAQLETATEAAKHGDAERVAQNLDPAIMPQIYDQLSPETRLKVAQLYGAAELKLGKLGPAHHALVLASENSNAGMEDWRQRLAAATRANDAADAYLAFQQLRERWPEFVSTLSVADALRIDRQFASLKSARDARRSLAETLVQRDWHPPEPTEDPSAYWLPYAVSLAQNRQADDAIAAAGRIFDPMIVVEMRADRRFDAAVAKAPDIFDPIARGRAWLAKMQKLSGDAPRSFAAKIAVARAYHKLGQDQKALDVLDEASRKGAGRCKEHAAFDDYCEQSLSARRLRGETLIALGRTDEGVGEYLSLLDGPQMENDLLDLAAAAELNAMGRGKEALAILNSPFPDSLDPNWPAMRAEVRACTLAHMKRMKQMAQDIAFLKAHRAQAPLDLANAQLCAGDLGGAAATYIAMLRSPSNRPEALGALQIYGDEGFTRFDRTLLKRAAIVRKRRDVQTALNAVGRIAKYDLRKY